MIALPRFISWKQGSPSGATALGVSLQGRDTPLGAGTLPVVPCWVGPAHTRAGIKHAPERRPRGRAEPGRRVFPRVTAFSSSVYAGCAGLRFPQPVSLRMPSKLTCAWEPGRHVSPGRREPAAHLLPSPTPTPPSPPADGTGTATSLYFFRILALLILPPPHTLASSENGREGRHTSSTVVTRCTALGIFTFVFLEWESNDQLLICYFISDYFFSDLNCIYYKLSAPVCASTRAHACVCTRVCTRMCVCPKKVRISSFLPTA